MQSRMRNPMLVIPDVMPAVMSMAQALNTPCVSQTIVNLVSLRASQVNGSSVCVDLFTRNARNAVETDGRLFSLAAWWDAACFDDAERAAIALCEEVTRMSDRSKPVSDETWNEAAQHFSEEALAVLILTIGMVNSGNRVNAATRQNVNECECPPTK
ncbi:carboxymuconolactone decarboxylase family protein [Schlesneria sp. T3-172]|uniref:carboxymuconolactone decarboxylase family protein n=1 Tax=Schlesneria sphaerica TaxID=3373610 RepID=UPI0037C8A21D